MRKVALLVGALVTSCTFAEPRIRPEPVVTPLAPGFTSRIRTLFTSKKRTPTARIGDITFRCSEWHSYSAGIVDFLPEFFSGTSSARDECIFVTADAEAIQNVKLPSSPPVACANAPAQATPSESPSAKSNSSAAPTPTPTPKPGPTPSDEAQKVSNFADVLMDASDYNCANFLSGAFAVKTNAGFFGSVANTILSASNTVLTGAAGVPLQVPQAISGGNAVVSGTGTALNSSYYANQSFDVLESGIAAARKELRAQIGARLCMTRYPGNQNCNIPSKAHYEGFCAQPYRGTAEVLQDIMEYDRVCSFEGGLRELANDAARKQQKADEAAGLGTPTPSPSAAATPSSSPSAGATAASQPSAAASPSGRGPRRRRSS